MKSLIIGIAGGTGSGKTTLTERLRDHFGADEVSVLNHDSYYKRHDELPYEERCKLNYDHPDSFDTELLVQHLQALRRGESVKVPVYDYTIHNRSDKTITVHPAPVIIVEGILIFASQELCDMMDMKVFVDTDADVRILRRIVRDVKERGRTLDSVDYSEKLTEIIRENNIKSVTIVRMEVPCCGGLELAAKKALQQSGKFIPWQVVTVTVDGRLVEE